MGSVDRPPDLVAELRSMKSKIAELEGRILNRVVAAACVRASGLSALHNTPLVATFSTVEFDTAGLFNAGAPDRLTAPISGLYVIVGTFGMANNATGDRSVSISGNDIFPTTGVIMPAPAGTYFASIPRIVELEAGEYQQLTGLQTSGTTLSASASFTMMWMGVLP